MKILYGTSNTAKLNAMKSILENINIELVGLGDIEGPELTILEEGMEPIDNAREKALAYYKAYKTPVFSIDSGLYFLDAPHLKEPKTYVRRYTGTEMSDDEMITHYSKLAESNGGFITAQYLNAIVLIIDENTRYELQDPCISYAPFLLTSQPHKKRIKGFPLDSISMEVKSKSYFYDLQVQSEDSTKRRKALQKFFHDALKKS